MHSNADRAAYIHASDCGCSIQRWTSIVSQPLSAYICAPDCAWHVQHLMCAISQAVRASSKKRVVLQTMLHKPAPLTVPGVYKTLRQIAVEKGPGSASRRQQAVLGMLRSCRYKFDFQILSLKCEIVSFDLSL